ncbi:MAG TPA: LD-carboxypeptidase [Euzebyales bacterium]|nr:LD-carboxypeptidase [Euzebyales bacterium]
MWPRPLRAGDTVAVVSPSSPVPVDRLAAGIEVLRSWGLRPREGRHARAVHGHLAGSDAQRVDDLNAAFRDPAVRAVWASRGGYGVTRILDRLDWAALRRDPKLLIGFSDMTGLLVAARQRTGLIGVHGQFVARLHLLEARARVWLRDLVFGRGAPAWIRGARLPGAPLGRVTAPLVGGNLAVLAALAGTGDRLRAAGCVVLLEEVAEAPYAVDRLLTQLRHSGCLRGSAGLAVGTPVGCDPAPGRQSATVEAVLEERLAGLGVPVVTGLALGHVDHQRAVPHGAPATLDADRGALRVCGDLGGPAPG